MKAGLPVKVMVRTRIPYFNFAGSHACTPQIDCSHGNSLKQHQRQIDVAEDIVRTFHDFERWRRSDHFLRRTNSKLATLRR
jgi:hypothetical protein